MFMSRGRAVLKRVAALVTVLTLTPIVIFADTSEVARNNVTATVVTPTEWSIANQGFFDLGEQAIDIKLPIDRYPLSCPDFYFYTDKLYFDPSGKVVRSYDTSDSGYAELHKFGHTHSEDSPVEGKFTPTHISSKNVCHTESSLNIYLQDNVEVNPYYVNNGQIYDTSPVSVLNTLLENMAPEDNVTKVQYTMDGKKWDVIYYCDAFQPTDNWSMIMPLRAYIMSTLNNGRIDVCIELTHYNDDPVNMDLYSRFEELKYETQMIIKTYTEEGYR